MNRTEQFVEQHKGKVAWLKTEHRATCLAEYGVIIGYHSFPDEPQHIEGRVVMRVDLGYAERTMYVPMDYIERVEDDEPLPLPG